MLSQTILPIHYNFEKTISGLTGFAGLPLYIEMAAVSGLATTLNQTLSTKTQGWHDEQIILSLILLNLAGGDCVDDIEQLNMDDGLSTLLLKLETHGMKRSARRAYEKRWRKNKTRALPSVSVIHRYLEQFHDASQEDKRVDGKAFIPEQNSLLQALLSVQQTLIDFAQQHHQSETATLDQDATLSATGKQTAFYCYKKFKAYQPFNTYWAEQQLLLHSEFRDGNVPAGFEQLRLLKEAIARLPSGVKQVRLRSDSAGYQHDLIHYCSSGENERFGIIDFVISTNVSASFKQAVAELEEDAWKPIIKDGTEGHAIKTDQEWAEVCFVPSWLCHKKNEPPLRFIAIREALQVQQTLDLGESNDPTQAELPFPTIKLNKTAYKLFGIVTNRLTEPGNELINWHRERCGDSEKVHSIEKTDLVGGQFPSNKFGANAAWWAIMCLTFNLQTLMNNLALPKSLKSKRMKRLRFKLIALPGRVIQHARVLSIKLNTSLDIVKQIKYIRERIAILAQPPPDLIVD